jgi:hypothetical protein
MEECPPLWRVAANVLNKQWRTKLLIVKTYQVTKCSSRKPQTWDDTVVQCLAVSKEKCATFALHRIYSGSCQNIDISIVCTLCSSGL